LPIHTEMDEAQQQYIIDSVLTFFNYHHKWKIFQS
jgi:hypothetical protein